MIDKKALYTISQGVYLLSTIDPATGRAVGRVVDAVSQVASGEPKRVSVACMKEGFTSKVLLESRHFALTTLAVDAPMALIEAFGYQSSETVDKFLGWELSTDAAGTPYVKDGAIALMCCDVFDVLDMGSHWLFLGDVVEAAMFSKAEPMTYGGYRAMKAAAKAAKAEDKPAAPAAAGKSKWQCMICGFEVEIDGDELPADFSCPRCGVGRELFQRV